MEKRTYNVLFAGTPQFAVPILEILYSLPHISVLGVLTQPDKPTGRSQRMTPSEVKKAATAHGTPVFTYEKLSTPEVAVALSDLHIDVAVTAAYGKIIPQKLLDLFPFGWLNVHASVLPKLRGASPIAHAILHGFTETGVTLMRMDAGLDTGPVLTSEKIPIGPRETSETLHGKLSALGAKIVGSSLISYLEGTIKSIPQQEEGATICGVLKREDGKIDWKQSAIEIDGHIRAMTPWPGSFTQFIGENMKILDAKPVRLPAGPIAGKLTWDGAQLLVDTTAEQLSILRLQIAGKKPMTAKEFVNGFGGKLPVVLE
ncbi:MAG: methionyl-tRNA formyltransferase [Patescibacteria group bacterium]|jgi:methionyl-tRNA formyltransferase